MQVQLYILESQRGSVRHACGQSESSPNALVTLLLLISYFYALILFFSSRVTSVLVTLLHFNINGWPVPLPVFRVGFSC